MKRLNSILSKLNDSYKKEVFMTGDDLTYLLNKLNIKIHYKTRDSLNNFALVVKIKDYSIYSYSIKPARAFDYKSVNLKLKFLETLQLIK